MSDKHIIYVGIIFAIIIAAVLFFSNFPQEFKIQVSKPIDMSNDTISGPPMDPYPVTIRIFNLDSMGHNVSFDMRESNNHNNKIYIEDFYLEPSSYREYNYTYTDEHYFMRVVTDRDTPSGAVRSINHNFGGVKVLEFEINRDGIDIGFVYIYD